MNRQCGSLKRLLYCRLDSVNESEDATSEILYRIEMEIS